MKKFISVLLCFALLVPVCIVPAFAAETKTPAAGSVTVASSLESAFAEGENSIMLFVTGIGQSNSYLFDSSYTADGAFANGSLQDYENYAPLIAEGKYTARWNLFNNNFDEALKKPSTILAALGVVAGLLFSMVSRRNFVSDKSIDTLIRNLFSYNILDENGNCDARVVTPRYTCPLSEYPTYTTSDGAVSSEAKSRFYGSIPCAEIARESFGSNYEDYLYCYNYSAFSYTSDNVDGLHEYIETVLKTNKIGADKVVLIPMSMGASVVSAYLAKYPSVAQNHVKRVVSIVGCWNGSDIVSDLINLDYASNSADLVYNGLLAELIGEPWGSLVNVIIRLFPKAGLRDFIDQALGSLVENIFLSTPSLFALVPSYDYQSLRGLITNPNVLAETDTYYNAQSTLKERLEALEQQGVTFSFISGYGLPYGAVTTDYKAFGFLASAATTNSDEIINIDSTSPGTQYVAANSQFADSENRELSPDKTIDISQTYYKNSSWYFYGQKHELEHNNTAIKLAIQLALGNIKTVQDCDNLEEDGVLYPQFNEARNLKSLNRNYIPDLQRYCAENSYTLSVDQQAVYDKVIAMTNSTVNDYDLDNAAIEEFRQMLIAIGVYGPDAEASTLDKTLNTIFKNSSDTAYKIFGAKGFLDFFG